MQLSMTRAPSMRPLAAIATVALLILALAATAVFIGSRRREAPPPFGVARNGAVVFEENGDLFIADALGGTSRILVGGPEREVAPAFSNQGDRVAFVREVRGGIRLMSVRPDGSDLTALGDFPSFDGLRWSPDGSSLLINYTETDPTGFRLSIVDADGTGSRELDLGVAPDWASWRPGGRHMAFRGHVGEGPAAGYIADADGTNVRRLDIETSDVFDLEGLFWSPDGTRLSFMSGLDDGWQIGIADVDATGSVTDVHRMKFDPESKDEMLPNWSPDSTQFAFQLEKDGVSQVAIARPDGSGLRMVGPRTVDRDGLGYTWSPDGKTLLIASTFGEKTLWSVDPSTGEATGLEGPTDRIGAWQRLAP